MNPSDEHAEDLCKKVRERGFEALTKSELKIVQTYAKRLNAERDANLAKEWRTIIDSGKRK